MDKYFLEKLSKVFFLINALIAVISVVAIIGFIFFNGIMPFLPFNSHGTYSLGKFLTGLQWIPKDSTSGASFGILYMIIGSIFSSFGAIIVAVPIGILTAIYITEFASKRLAAVLIYLVELLSGIPSVIFGIFGLGVIVPIIMDKSPYNQGQSLLAVIMVLSVMVLPIIISISINALRAVPIYYKEGSYALGASKIYTIFKVVLPAAKSGLTTGVVLGIGRAIGETMAVMLVAGNPAGGIPSSLFSPVRPLTTNIALEMGYAFGLHQQMLFSTAVVLLVFIIVINLILNRIKAGDINGR